MQPRVFLELAEEISDPLTSVLDNSWRTREIPEESESSHNVPVLEKRKWSDPSSSRVASLT